MKDNFIGNILLGWFCFCLFNPLNVLLCCIFVCMISGERSNIILKVFCPSNFFKKFVFDFLQLYLHGRENFSFVFTCRPGVKARIEEPHSQEDPHILFLSLTYSKLSFQQLVHYPVSAVVFQLFLVNSKSLYLHCPTVLSTGICPLYSSLKDVSKSYWCSVCWLFFLFWGKEQVTLKFFTSDYKPEVLYLDC